MVEESTFIDRWTAVGQTKKCEKCALSRNAGIARSARIDDHGVASTPSSPPGEETAAAEQLALSKFSKT
jgi:hypothetical protein